MRRRSSFPPDRPCPSITPTTTRHNPRNPHAPPGECPTANGHQRNGGALVPVRCARSAAAGGADAQPVCEGSCGGNQRPADDARERSGERCAARRSGADVNRSRRTASAVEEFKASLKLRPDLAAARFNVGAALLAAGDRRGAALTSSRRSRLIPITPSLIATLARSFQADGEVSGAMSLTGARSTWRRLMPRSS